MPPRNINFSCPKTRRGIDTGVATNASSLAANWDKTLRLRCPHCGEVHTVPVREAFTEGVLNDQGREV